MLWKVKSSNSNARRKDKPLPSREYPTRNQNAVRVSQSRFCPCSAMVEERAGLITHKKLLEFSAKVRLERFPLNTDVKTGTKRQMTKYVLLNDVI